MNTVMIENEIEIQKKNYLFIYLFIYSFIYYFNDFIVPHSYILPGSGLALGGLSI